MKVIQDTSKILSLDLPISVSFRKDGFDKIPELIQDFGEGKHLGKNVVEIGK